MRLLYNSIATLVVWSMVFLTAAVLPTALLLKNYSFKTSSLLLTASSLSAVVSGVTAFSTVASPRIFVKAMSSPPPPPQRMTTRSASKKRSPSPDDWLDILPVVNTSSSNDAVTPVSKKPKQSRRKNNHRTPVTATAAAAVITPLPADAAAGSTSSMIEPTTLSISSFASTATANNNIDPAASSSCSSSSIIDLTQLLISTLDDNDKHFQDLEIPPEELRPSAVVTVGQSFHWRALAAATSAAAAPPLPKQTSSSSNNDSSNHADDDDDDDDDDGNNKSSASAWGTHDATQWLGILRRRRRPAATTSTTTLPPASSSKMVKTEDNDNDDDDSCSFDSLVVILRETPTTTLYRVLYPTQNEDIDARAFLLEYFRLQDASSTNTTSSSTTTTSATMTASATTTSYTFGPCLKDLYAEWSQACPRLRAIAAVIPGVRIIQQDPLECLVSFICSTNNNIPRITKMLTAIRQAYGTPLVRVKLVVDEQEEEEAAETLYSFPSLQQLLEHATERDLRNMGFGYRAPYIMKTIYQLHELGGEAYLHQLRAFQDSNEVQEALLQFTGVGRKVADCVALFSLQQDDAIPVDVHVWKMARRDYDNNHDDNDNDNQDGNSQQKKLTNVKSLTPTIYRHVGDLFRTRFPTKPGWAHSLLFVAELPSFRPVLPQHVVDEMDKFRIEQKQQQQLAKHAKQKKKKMSATTTTTTKKKAGK